MATLEKVFYKRLLIELSPISEEHLSFELNRFFTVNSINLSNSEVSIKVVNFKQENIKE